MGETVAVEAQTSMTTEWVQQPPDRKNKDSCGIEQNQSFNELTIGGVPIVFHFASSLFASPLVRKTIDSVNDIKLKQIGCIISS